MSIITINYNNTAGLKKPLSDSQVLMSIQNCRKISGAFSKIFIEPDYFNSNTYL